MVAPQPLGPVFLSIRPALDHSHEAVWNVPEIGRFAEHALRGGPPLPRLGPIGRAQGSLAAGRLEADPPPRATAWYFLAEDRSGNLASSPHEEPG